jgi:septal ring-binding cell division protein DamX
MADEGFHEIQLNGKQLVFLFMAATVVSVVIFLCGVMVGRGVRPALAAAAEETAQAAIDPTASVRGSSAASPAITERQPISTQEELTYAERLERAVPPRETLKESAPSIAADAAPAPKPAPESAAVETRESDPIEKASLTVPPGNGWVVQVGAYPRSTAETIARGLAAKGFPSFIMPRDRGLFAVRVGKYTDRREADAVKLRLEQDEQFKNPWITR